MENTGKAGPPLNRPTTNLDMILVARRRPCRICRTRTRPAVPVGSSKWWDLCHRCACGVSNLERHSRAAAIDAWRSRIARDDVA